MSIDFIRIDDRLIHGQIVMAWIKSFSTQRILIIDDLVAKDEFLINVMRMVSPSDIDLFVRNRKEIKELIVQFVKDEKKTMILVKNPETAKLLFESGISLKSLNVGGMEAKKGRTQLYKNVSASREEIKVLQEIENAGIDVYFQATPTNMKVKLNQVI